MLLAAPILAPLLISCSSLSIDAGALLQKCDKPELKGETWRDIAELAAERGQAIDECNLMIEKVRELNK